jgi:ABC-2 type transport system ATP-binding protein
MRKESMFEITGVTATYRQSGFSLGPLDLQFDKGITSLLGSNGAGKSTLLRILAGTQKPKTGRLISQANSTIGYLPQFFQLPGRARCAQFLDHIAWLWQVPSSSRHQFVAQALERVGLLDKANERIKTLSGGMRQRLAIAKAIVHQPSVLLLDEPTVGLDPAQRLEIRGVIQEIGQDCPTLLSTHLLEDVRMLGGRMIVLRSGKIVYDGSLKQVATNNDMEAFETQVARWMVGGE